ncbi:MAG: porphobilinogen synthase [Actinobacteria bacterium]|nr:MAG: porphobilinogen synthase [Actinomycetota bacterium]
MNAFPATRLRRLRRSGALRSLVRETRLDRADLVYPLFVGPESRVNEELPALGRFSVDDLSSEVEELIGLGLSAVILFGIPEEKDDEGSGAYVSDGILQRALRSLRERYPDLVLVTDVCLCEYTSHGHCGVIENGEVANDATLELLARTAVSHVEAGADVVAPSDMMDGRVAALRAALDDAGFAETPIVSYAAKYASAFYGPFREAAESAPSFGEIVKPALPNLDVIRAARERFDLPVAAYNVSGEYAMVKAAAARGWLDERQAAIESLTAVSRAGADFVVTYWAKELVAWL